tara:strand:- start:55501 stop:56856 length:1356 start_codon:yes stop_codon:yes gene_type:complete
MADYYGVYSQVENMAGNHIVRPQGQGTILGVKSTGTKNRNALSTADLEAADLNVAKIRLVSTLPDKQVAESLKSKAYVGFILTSVQESHSEKLQIIPLPGDTYASYFYGAQPRQFSFNGVLLNTQEDMWRDSFEQLYEQHIRGSAASRNFNIVQVSYGNRVVSGWLTQMNQQIEGSSDLYNAFSFTVLVSRTDIIGGDKELYKKYLTSQVGILNQSNIENDFAILSSENYNALVDPVRSGFTKTPPRPKRRRGRSNTAPSCSYAASTTQGGKPTLAAGKLVSNDIVSGAKCSYANKFRIELNKINDVKKELEDMKKPESKATPEEVKAKITEYNKRVLAYNTKLDNKEITAQLDAEVRAAAAIKYRQSGSGKGKTFTIQSKSGTQVVAVTVSKAQGEEPKFTVTRPKKQIADEALMDEVAAENTRRTKAKAKKLKTKRDNRNAAQTAAAFN